MHNFCSISNYKLGEIAYSFVSSGLILYLIQLMQNYYFNTIWIGELVSILIAYTNLSSKRYVVNVNFSAALETQLR